MTARCDLIVVGAGVAGLSAALAAADAGLSVDVLHKGSAWRADRPNWETATTCAQGGIAVAADDADASNLGVSDTVDLHVSDTVAAGGELVDVDVARDILTAGRAAVETLVDRGVQFDLAADGSPARTREGGHSRRRILHAGGDATGAEIQRALGVAALAHPGITLLDNATVSEVLLAEGVVVGVAYLRGLHHEARYAPTVVLATGGSGQLYTATTNPLGATADGLALALRAGASVADVEFVQFHPTMLYTPGVRGRRLLISEAVRGEGGRLVDDTGVSVTAGVHPRGDLAPRDVVANAIRRTLDHSGASCVYLDIRGVDDFATRFPTVTAGVRAAGIDLDAGRIPVVPGAHYQCGGVVTDTHGRTAIPGLLAAGEVARTGLHGANRLASNSLLEAAVVGARTAQVALRRSGDGPASARGRCSDQPSTPTLGPIVPRAELQDMMSRHVALARDEFGLETAARRIAEAPPRVLTTAGDVEDAALTAVAAVLVAAARARTETLGSHVRSDPSDLFTRPVSHCFVLADGAPSEDLEKCLQPVNASE